MGPDDELNNLIKAYKEDINIDKVVQRRLQDKMEKNVFIKKTLSNLLLTMLGFSCLAPSIEFQLTVVVFLVIINLIYFYLYQKRQREKNV